MLLLGDVPAFSSSIDGNDFSLCLNLGLHIMSLLHAIIRLSLLQVSLLRNQNMLPVTEADKQ
jgi:hypothetical protein